MIETLKYTWKILVLSSLLTLTGILLLPQINNAPPVGQFLVTVASLTLINIAAWIILYRGIRKSNREGTFMVTAGLGLKFLLYLLYILAFWLVTKNLSKAFIIVFFALYLTFTLFLAANLIKLLKNK
jgi:hypothetical protein